MTYVESEQPSVENWVVDGGAMVLVATTASLRCGGLGGGVAPVSKMRPEVVDLVVAHFTAAT